MNKIILRKACGVRGADHGRPAFLPRDRAANVKLRLWHLKLDSYGYDSGGAYWGCREYPNKIYWAESLLEFELSEYDRPPVGTIELTVDASSRAEAKNKIRELLSNAKFYS